MRVLVVAGGERGGVTCLAACLLLFLLLLSLVMSGKMCLMSVYPSMSRGHEGWFPLLQVVYGRAGGLSGFSQPPAADVLCFLCHRVMSALHDGRVGHGQAVDANRTTNAVGGLPPLPHLCPPVYVVTDQGDGTIGASVEPHAWHY